MSGLALPGCLATPSDYAADANAEVFPILEHVGRTQVGSRASWIQQPEAAAEGQDVEGHSIDGQTDPLVDSDGGADASLRSDDPAPRSLDLASALSTAVGTSREYLTRRESVYLQGLSLTLTRYSFGPIMDATISALWTNAEGFGEAWSLGPSFSVSKILDDGGRLSFAVSAAADDASQGTRGFDTDLDLTYAQPLMRGAGYEASHEALTQAEQNLIYEVRDFELFREDFSIDVADSFFDLVSQQQRLNNIDQSYRQAVFDRKKSEALRQVDRNQDEDVFNARRREVDEENRLLVARNELKRALDDFKIQLGLPTSAPLDIEDVEPPFLPIRLDMASAVSVALHNRLDLQTTQDRVKDAVRQLRVAADRLRADLDLTLNLGSSGAAADFQDAEPEDWSGSAGLSLSFPLDRQSERNAYRAALIQVERVERQLSLQEDTIERDVRNQLRSLRTAEDLIIIQRDQIEQERRAVAVTQIRYEAGDSDQRDLSDARQALVDAENRLIDLLADHFIARLQLLRTLGVLFIDDEGMWRT